jgi:ketosteroid isomerase-like protein
MHAAYPSKGITMSSTNRRSFLARGAALAAVPAAAALAGGTLTGQASAATLPDQAPVPPSGLPLTNRHLTEREKANLAVVLQAYHDGEGDSLDPQGFMDLFAEDGVLNGIGGVDGQDSLRGTQLSGLITLLAQFLPDIHRELKEITVSGDVVCIELSIQGTFLGPFQTPVGTIQPTGAKLDFPTADFWYLRDGKVEVFDCHIAFTTLFAQLGVLPDFASAVGKGN